MRCPCDLPVPSVDPDLLHRFEERLEPAFPERSGVEPAVIGYGEMSTVFRIPGSDDVAYKRMPLFRTVADAKRYVSAFVEYSDHLRDAGIAVPPQETAIVSVSGRPVVLYIAQPMLPPERFCHALAKTADTGTARAIAATVRAEITRVWEWNRRSAPWRELSLDGQLSNWVLLEEGQRPFYVDTSTPMYRIDGVEQLDPELFLQSAPAALRWVLRLFFVQDVMTRYYDMRKVLQDLAANLFKEGRPDLIADVVDEINAALDGSPLTADEIRRYYSGDRTIWTVYLAFRRMDRWVTTRLRKRRYEFVLPGKIAR